MFKWRDKFSYKRTYQNCIISFGVCVCGSNDYNNGRCGKYAEYFGEPFDLPEILDGIILSLVYDVVFML